VLIVDTSIEYDTEVSPGLYNVAPFPSEANKNPVEGVWVTREEGIKNVFL